MKKETKSLLVPIRNKVLGKFCNSKADFRLSVFYIVFDYSRAYSSLVIHMFFVTL